MTEALTSDVACASILTGLLNSCEVDADQLEVALRIRDVNAFHSPLNVVLVKWAALGLEA